MDLSKLAGREIRVRAGEPIRVDVPVTGSPAPLVSWQKENKALDPSDRVGIWHLSIITFIYYHVWTIVSRMFHVNQRCHFKVVLRLVVLDFLQPKPESRLLCTEYNELISCKGDGTELSVTYDHQVTAESAILAYLSCFGSVEPHPKLMNERTN